MQYVHYGDWTWKETANWRFYILSCLSAQTPPTPLLPPLTWQWQWQCDEGDGGGRTVGQTMWCRTRQGPRWAGVWGSAVPSAVFGRCRNRGGSSPETVFLSVSPIANDTFQSLPQRTIRQWSILCFLKSNVFQAS